MSLTLLLLSSPFRIFSELQARANLQQSPSGVVSTSHLRSGTRGNGASSRSGSSGAPVASHTGTQGLSSSSRGISGSQGHSSSTSGSAPPVTPVAAVVGPGSTTNGANPSSSSSQSSSSAIGAITVAPHGVSPPPLEPANKQEGGSEPKKEAKKGAKKAKKEAKKAAAAAKKYEEQIRERPWTANDFTPVVSQTGWFTLHNTLKEDFCEDCMGTVQQGRIRRGR